LTLLIDHVIKEVKMSNNQNPDEDLNKSFYAKTENLHDSENEFEPVKQDSESVR
jgi:hypothetical protein